IACVVALGEAARERGLVAHEMPAQLAAEEIKELMRLDGAERDVGAGDHLDSANMPPMLGQALEQRVAAPPEREHAQKCQVAAQASRRARELLAGRQHELEDE